jgi:hypothetical protein
MYENEPNVLGSSLHQS